MELKYGILGKIKEGKNFGCFVKFIDDREHTGGFYIYEFKDVKGKEGFDTWLETEDDVKGYVNENEWIIEWLTEYHQSLNKRLPMLDVKHYLGIYKLRKEMMEKGTTDPLPEGRRLINEIVSKLSKMNLDEKIDVKIKDGKYVMVDSDENIIVTFSSLGDDYISSIK